jgi:hypothetical protein
LEFFSELSGFLLGRRLGHGTKSIALATFNVEYFTAVEMQVDYTDGMELSLLMGSLVN